MVKVLGYLGMVFIDCVKAGVGEIKSVDDLRAVPENDIFGGGQVGIVYDMDNCEFNQEAITLLKQVKRSGDDIGDVDMFMAGEKKIFAWMGGVKRVVNVEEAEGSSTYDATMLDTITPVEMEVPEDIKAFMESQ